MGGEKPAPRSERRKSQGEVKQVFTRILERAGVQEYDRRVLLTLVFDGRLDAATLAQKAEVPQSKVYEVLNRLSGGGLVFCEDEAARPKVYVAARPEVIVDVLTRPLQEIQSNAGRIEPELTELYENALEGVKTDEPGRYFASHVTQAGISSEMFSAVRAARSLLAVGRDFSWLTEIPRLKDIVATMSRGGGTVRLLSSEAAPSEPLLALDAGLKEAGVELRCGSHLRGRYIILDDRTVLVGVRRRSPRASEPAYALVRVDSDELAADLVAHFTAAWTESRAIGGT